MRSGTAAVLAVVVVGCASSGTRVNTDFDPATDFSHYKTYSWNDDRPVRNQLTDQRIVAAVDRQLQAKGLTKVDSGAGDLIVSYRAKVDTSSQATTYIESDPAWGGWRWGGVQTATAQTTYSQMRTGSVIVGLMDRQKNQLVWRGVASTELQGQLTPEERAQRINDAMQKLFMGYPPKASA
jgi:hypothetical protein